MIVQWVTGAGSSVILLVSAAIFVFGVFTIHRGFKLYLLKMRRRTIARGSWLILLSLFIGYSSTFFRPTVQPILEKYFPPSPTPTLTATNTSIPTATTTATLAPLPSETATPVHTETPVPTSTPFLPLEVQFKFTSNVSPAQNIVFSPMVFSQDLDLVTYTPIGEAEMFAVPVRKIVATFSYDGMNTGAQWTVVWFKNNQMIYYETFEWQDNLGGYGFAELDSKKVPITVGDYQAVIFVGFDWMSAGSFSVVDKLPAPTKEATSASP